MEATRVVGDWNPGAVGAAAVQYEDQKAKGGFF